MPDDDSYLKTEREMILSAHRQNRGELIAFYKALGLPSRKRIPAQMKKEDDESGLIQESEKALGNQIDSFSKIATSLSNQQADITIGRLAVAMFLLDRTKKLRKLAMDKDDISFYSLYLSLRNQVCTILDDAYYLSPPEQVIGDFLDLEPLLTACSELCGLAVPELGEIVSEFKKSLAEEVSKRG